MANMDYLCNRIDELENEVATLDEKRNEYQILSEDLEKELEELKEHHEKLLMENEDLSDKLDIAFLEIRRLHSTIANIRAFNVIDSISSGRYKNEE